MIQRNRKALCIVGAVLVVALAILVATISADPTPTTPRTRRLFGLWGWGHVAAVAALLGVAAYLLLASTGKKEHRFAYLGTLIVCGAFYGFLEVVGQIGIFSWSNIFRGGDSELYGLGFTRIPNVDREVVSFQDTAMAWGLKSDPITFDFKSDAVGFRNDIDPRTADIVLIGDSLIQGPLIRQGDLINNVLSEEIGRKVAQAALLGLSPQAAQSVFWNAQIPPDGKIIVQFIFEGNDLMDSRAFESREELFVEDSLAEMPYPLLAKEIWRVLTVMTDSQQGLQGLDVCLIGSQPYTFRWTGWAIKGFESESENILRSFTEFAERIGDEGGEFLLVYIPSKLRVLAESCDFPEGSGIANVEEHLSPLREEVTKWAEMAGVPLLDLTEPLQRQARTGEIPWFWGDTHWNELGHAVAAREIASWLPFRSALESQGKVGGGAGQPKLRPG